VANQVLLGKPFEQGSFANVNRSLSHQEIGDRP
jgi:hypothetical protein